MHSTPDNRNTRTQPNERYVVALEIGSSRAKIGVAGFDPDDPTHRLTIYNTVELPTVDSVRYGRINNVREVTHVITELLDDIEKQQPVDGRTVLSVYLSIGGRSLKAVKTKARIDLPERTEITERLIHDLRKQAIENLATTADLICVEPVRFTVDNMPTPRPVGSLGTRLAAEFTAVVCNPANRKDLVDVVSERAGLNVSGITVRPIALAHLVLTPQEINAGCMLVDVGAETITVAIYKKYALQYLVTIPIGARLITRDIATVLALTEEQAEVLKLRMADAIPEPCDNVDADPEDVKLQETVDAVVVARVADLVANIAAQPEFAGMSAESLPAGIILAGGGARLRNFARLLESHTGMRVRIATLPPDIIISDAGLSAADNLDIIALLNESAESARAGGDAECLSAPRPVRPERDDKPADDVKTTPEVVVDMTPAPAKNGNKDDNGAPRDTRASGGEPRFDKSVAGYGYEPADFEALSGAPAYSGNGGFDITGTERKKNPHPRDLYDDEPDYLTDIDEDDPFEEEEQAERERRKYEEAVRKKAEKEERERQRRERIKKHTRRLDNIIAKAAGYLTGQGEDNSTDLE